jgi:hypothetical protein
LVGGIGPRAGCGKKRWQPIHADRHLIGGLAHGNARRPRNDGRNAQTAFKQLCLPACKRPGIGEALAAVVAAEDNDGVVGDAVGVKRFKHAANLEIEVLDHALIGPLRPAIKIDERVTDEPPGFGLISRPLPRPVRRIEVQAQQEGLSSFGIAVDDIDGMAAE